MMKLPNGYGSVFKLKGNRRNPFMVKKTVGWNDKGHPITKIIGYFPTRKAGMQALAEYNHNPFDIDFAKMTMEEIYLRWSERDFPKYSKSFHAQMNTAFKHSKLLHNIQYKIIKAWQIQEVIDNCGAGYGTQQQIKGLFSHLDKYALELDIINKSNAQLVKCAPFVQANKKPFSDEEVDLLWKNSNDEWVDSVLILIYTGFRIGEFLDLEIANIDIKQGFIRGGKKTTAGKDRIVPIHSLIEPFIKRRILTSKAFLIERKGKPITASLYYKFWGEIMQKLHMQHTPHECRHTFRTKLDEVDANRVCIDLMMGHKNPNIGERVYTHKTLEQLKFALSLVTH